MNELDELLVLHNRILRQSRQAHPQLAGHPDELAAFTRALVAADRQLHALVDRFPEEFSPDTRREAIRTMARVRALLSVFERTLDSSIFVR